jgi:nucleotide-binding universal stress UspA family protein
MDAGWVTERGDASVVKTILAGVDGSDLAREAVEQARALLGDGHRWELVTVVSTHPPSAGVLGRIDPPLLSGDTVAADRRAAEEQAMDLATGLGLTGDVRVEAGEPGPVLCRLAQSLPADLVVVGSHGRGPIGRAILGSVSQHVLAHAPCPVLVQRSVGAHPASPGQLGAEPEDRAPARPS